MIFTELSIVKNFGSSFHAMMSPDNIDKFKYDMVK